MSANFFSFAFFSLASYYLRFLARLSVCFRRVRISSTSSVPSSCSSISSSPSSYSWFDIFSRVALFFSDSATEFDWTLTEFSSSSHIAAIVNLLGGSKSESADSESLSGLARGSSSRIGSFGFSSCLDWPMRSVD